MNNKTIIKNLGTIVSGDYGNPILKGDTICINGDRIGFIGFEADAPKDNYTVEIDANGLTIIPGLIDAHAHPPLANYIDCFKAYDWVDNYAGAGITSFFSVGGLRFPGAAKTAKAVKAQAIVAKNIWDNYHPSGVKVHCDAVMLAEGLTESDFAELAADGINVIGEIGMGEVKCPEKAAEMVKIAKKHGFISTIHCGGPSSKDGAQYSLEDIKKINPDVLCHINGAPAPMAEEDVKELVQSGNYYFDIVSNGNFAMIFKVAKWAIESGTINKMMIGTNIPSMNGYSPMGPWVAMIGCCQMTGLKPELAIPMVTGNVAKCYGLEHGIIKEGYIADFVIADDLLETLAVNAPPSLACTITNGVFTLPGCKNTPPPKKRPIVKKLA
jgi:enamidase